MPTYIKLFTDYDETFDEMSDTEAGRLIKALIHYGASGEMLISGYSAACDCLPFGTKLLIETNLFTKEIRIDDCGVGSNNMLDLYYYDRSEIPSDFLQLSRLNAKITIIE